MGGSAPEPTTVQLKDVKVSVIKGLEKARYDGPKIYPLPTDLPVKDCYMPMILLYRLSGNSEEFSQFVTILKESLQKVLVPFFGFAGRWVPNEDHVRELICEDQGVPFIEACVDETLDSVIKPSADRFEAVFGLNGFEAMGMDPNSFPQKMGSDGSWPPFFVQVTGFKCGGVVLGPTFSHMHCDAESFLNLMVSWAEVARTNTTSIKPIFDRSLVTQAESETIWDLPQTNGEAPSGEPTPEEPSEMYTELLQKLDPNPFWITKVFEINIASINSMKQEARKAGDWPFMSTSDCVIGHLWKCLFDLHKARGDPRQVCLTNIIEGRKRFYKKPLPYMCANVTAMLVCPTIPDEELLTTPAYELARRFKAKATGFQPQDWVSPERIKEMMQVVAPSRAHVLNNSYMKFPVHDIDFGIGGKPYFVPRSNVATKIYKDFGGDVYTGVNFILPPIPGHTLSGGTLYLTCSERLVGDLEASEEFMSLFLRHPQQS